LAQTGDRDPACREHLAGCPTCRQALERVEQRFERIGRMARKSVPAPRRTFRLPQGRTAAARRRTRLVLALGTLALLVIVFASWLYQQDRDRTHGPLMEMAAHRLDEDRKLMQEVDALVDNALPPAFQNLASFSGPVFDEDLINRIVPSIEEDDNSLT
ncbi:MAG: hypothetical protein P8X55_21965, partial [Desulfosarcinaceae bacterium]